MCKSRRMLYFIIGYWKRMQYVRNVIYALIQAMEKMKENAMLKSCKREKMGSRPKSVIKRVNWQGYKYYKAIS